MKDIILMILADISLVIALILIGIRLAKDESVYPVMIGEIVFFIIILTLLNL